MKELKQLRIILLVLLAVFSALALRADDDGGDAVDWKKVDAMKTASLEQFITSHPEGGHVEDARTLLLLHHRMAEVRTNEARTQLIIPVLRQDDSQPIEEKKSEPNLAVRVIRPEDGDGRHAEYAPEAEIVGLAFTKLPVEPGVGVLSFRPFGKGPGAIRQTASGPVLPSQDGTILAIKTYGMNTKDVLTKLEGDESMFGRFHFITPNTTTDLTSSEGSAYFGVINGMGLVHLYGDVKVIKPDGSQIDIKENGH